MSSNYTDDRKVQAGYAHVVAAICAGLLLTACHRAPAPDAPPVTVVAMPVHALAGEAEGALHFPIEVAARDANAMSFRVAGQVIERRVRLGEKVHHGEVLARLDSADAGNQAAAANSALEAAEHRLVFARQQLDRDKAQQAQNLIAANQLEQSEDAYAAALAGRDQAKNQSMLASSALRYHSLIADHDGVITSEDADTGQVVAAGQAVYGMAWSGDMDVTLDAAASDIAKIARGQSADITLSALPGQHFTAIARDIAAAADPQSRTFRVKLTLAKAGPAVRLGMTGNAVLHLAGPGSSAGKSLFKIPATALFHQGNDPAVWIIGPDSKLALRPVTVQTYGERFVTVSSGVSEGDVLVLAGVHTVHEGQHVTPVKPLFTDEAAATPTPATIR